MFVMKWLCCYAMSATLFCFGIGYAVSNYISHIYMYILLYMKRDISIHFHIQNLSSLSLVYMVSELTDHGSEITLPHA